MLLRLNTLHISYVIMYMLNSANSRITFYYLMQFIYLTNRIKTISEIWKVFENKIVSALSSRDQNLKINIEQ